MKIATGGVGEWEMEGDGESHARKRRRHRRGGAMGVACQLVHRHAAPWRGEVDVDSLVRDHLTTPYSACRPHDELLSQFHHVRVVRVCLSSRGGWGY